MRGGRTQAIPKRNRLPLVVTSSGHTQCQVTQYRKSCFSEKKNVHFGLNHLVVSWYLFHLERRIKWNIVFRKQHSDIICPFFWNCANSMRKFQETDFSIDLKNKMTTRFTSAESNTQHVTRCRPWTVLNEMENEKLSTWPFGGETKKLLCSDSLFTARVFLVDTHM